MKVRFLRGPLLFAIITLLIALTETPGAAQAVCPPTDLRIRLSGEAPPSKLIALSAESEVVLTVLRGGERQPLII